MKLVNESLLKGAFLFEQEVHGDERGYFSEVYNYEKYKQYLPDRPFLQLNQSRSTGSVRRGLHFQYKKPQAKLVRVTKGCVIDVIVDLRLKSTTFGRSESYLLSEDNRYQLYIPRGFAHGFITLEHRSDTTDFEYLCDETYDPSGELCLNWNDPVLGLTDLNVDKCIISEKDANGLSLNDIIALGVLC